MTRIFFLPLVLLTLLTGCSGIASSVLGQLDVFGMKDAQYTLAKDNRSDAEKEATWCEDHADIAWSTPRCNLELKKKLEAEQQ